MGIQTDCKSILVNRIYCLRLHQSCLYADSLVFHFEHFYRCNLLADLFLAEHHYFQEHHRAHIANNRYTGTSGWSRLSSGLNKL
jgi:hypothetical protein